ncbi:hypothetical protein [Thermophilibacter sp.]
MVESYNISDKDWNLLSSWAEALDAPALFLRLPGHGDVGEDALIAELADMTYEKNVSNGVHRADSRRRHFARRNFPYAGSPSDVERFRDELEGRAEVTNDFHGVDCIDLTGWVGADPSKGGWDALVHHVQAHPHVDFVFTARCSERRHADRLVSLISVSCGVPVEPISMLPPTPVMLADSVFGGEGAGPGFDALVSWFEGLDTASLEISYALSRGVAAKARMLGADLNDPSRVEELLDGYDRTVAGLYGSSRFGF